MTTQNQTIRKILIAPDKFKGSLTSAQAADAIRKGILQAVSLHSGHDSEDICAREGDSLHSGQVSGQICAQEENSLRSEHVSGRICAQEGDSLHSGHILGQICAREEDSLRSEHVSGQICAREGDSLHSGHVSGQICAREENSLRSEHVSGQICAQEGDSLRSEQVSGQICAQEENSLRSEHVSGQICAQEENSLRSEHVSGRICAQEQQEGHQEVPEGLEFRIIEIADGGDGSLEVLQKRLPGCRVMEVPVHDPVGKRVESQILLYDMPGTGDAGMAAVKKCAFIEMAKVSGLEMLSKGERNPLHTSTYGMGEAIRAAIAHGAREITLSIGGSATNEGGSGMLQALGYRFLDAAGEEIAAPICGGDLGRVVSIVAPGAGASETSGTLLQGITFKVICDVTNPLLGPQGATAVYGPQKGADVQALQQLEAGLANYAATAEKSLGVPQECKEHPGAGAAGGVGYAGLAFLGAELIPGWRFFAQITSLEESVQWADLVITGEGSLDSQSLSGKVVSGVLNLAAQYNREVKIFCGVSKLTPGEMEAVSRTLPEGVGCYSIASLGHPLEVCMRDAAKLLQQLARENV